MKNSSKGRKSFLFNLFSTTIKIFTAEMCFTYHTTHIQGVQFNVFLIFARVAQLLPHALFFLLSFRIYKVPSVPEIK